MDRRVHPAHVVAVVVSVLVAASMPFVGRVLDAREARARQRMTSIALAMTAPRGFVAETACALRGPGNIRCGHTPGAPRTVAEQARQALAAQAGGPVALTCDQYPRTRRAMVPVRVECRVRFEDGDHDVLVTVATRTPSGNAPQLSDYLVQVS